MLIGSCASLGIIAEVTLRTFARPPDEQSLFFFPHSPAHAEQLLAAILTAPVTPAYLELVAPRTFAANPLQLPANEGAGPILIAGFLGRPESCAAQIALLRQLPAAQHTESISQPAAPSGRFRLWLTSEPSLLPPTPTPTPDLHPNPNPNLTPSPSPPPGIGFRLHAPSSQLAALLAALDSQVPNAWLVAEAQGIIRGTLPIDSALAILRHLAPTAPLLITQGPAPAHRPTRLYLRLKSALDPHHLFGQAPS